MGGHQARQAWRRLRCQEENVRGAHPRRRALPVLPTGKIWTSAQDWRVYLVLTSVFAVSEYSYLVHVVLFSCSICLLLLLQCRGRVKHTSVGTSLSFNHYIGSERGEVRYAREEETKGDSVRHCRGLQSTLLKTLLCQTTMVETLSCLLAIRC